MKRLILNCFAVKNVYRNVLFAVILFLTAFMAAEAGAVRIAVFPLEDLSRGANGVNLSLTRFLSQKLEERGEEVVPLDKMISYMARHRIRWLGFLDTKNILQMRRELEADIVLLGTVSQLQREPSAAIGLILTAVETNRARAVWNESGAVSCRDICNVLGLAEPEGVDDLQEFLADRLLQSWSPDTTPGEDAGRPVVRSSLIEPRHVKPGEEVRCAVKLYGTEGVIGDLASMMQLDKTVNYSSVAVKKKERGNRRQVQLMIGNNDYLTMEEQAENLYEVTWSAPDRDASIPVSLILQDSLSGQQVFFLGNYQVDNQAPRVSLKLNAGEYGGKKVFSESLTAIPIWEEPEPVLRWTFFIRNEKGQVLISGEGDGKPPRHFRWRGQRPDGFKAADGDYDVVFRVWDLAENVTTVTRRVTLKADPPVPRITVKKENGHLLFSFDGESDLAIVSWTGRFYFVDGETVLEEQGYSLPVQFKLPLSAGGKDRRLQAVVTLQDELGNRARKEIEDVGAYVPEEKKEKDSREQKWLEEF